MASATFCWRKSDAIRGCSQPLPVALIAGPRGGRAGGGEVPRRARGGAEGTGGFFVQAGRIMGILAWRFCTAPRILGCDPGRIFIIFEPSCTWL